MLKSYNRRRLYKRTMKIQVTYTSILTAFMLTSILSSLPVLYMKFKKTNYSRTEVRLLILAFSIIAARLLFPVEVLTVTHSVFVTTLYDGFCTWLRTPIIGDLPCYACLALFSLAGTFIIAAWKIRRYAVILHMIKRGTAAGSVNAGKEIPIIESRLVSEPFLAGLIHPFIVLPAELYGNRDDIIRHELNHYRHHDLLYKYFFELLCIIFWWNPVMYLLRDQIGNMLEIRNDFRTTASLSEEDRLQYADTLLAAAKGKSRSSFGIGLSGTQSFLKTRVYSVLNESEQKKTLIPIVLTIGMTLLSFGIIVEPSLSSDDLSSELYVCYPDESYIIENNGHFEIYLNGIYFYEYDHIFSDFAEFPVYQKGEYIDEKIIFNIIRSFHINRNPPCFYIRDAT